MTDPAPNPERQPSSPGVQPHLSLPNPVAETSNPIEAEPLPPVHEEEEGEEPLQHQLPLPPQSQQQPPPPFQPLFTLVTDSTTRATHHPRVHYIFSDDDPDILTEALAQHGSQGQNPSTSPSGSGTTLEARERPRQLSSTSTPTPSNERVIVLDLVPKTNNTTHSGEYGAATNTAAATGAGGGGGGYEVAWASSLSSDWAVVSANISPMADDINASSTGGGGGGAANNNTTDPDDENPQQQLILRIEGLGLDAVPLSSAPSHTPGGAHARKSSTATAATVTGVGAGIGRKSSFEERDLRMSGSSGAAAPHGQEKERGKEDYASIMDEFDKRMGVLRRVVDAGMERQRRLAAVDDDDDGDEGLGHEGLGLPPSGTHMHDWGAVTGGEEQGEGERGTALQQQQHQRQGRAASSASMRPSDGGE
ncbi:hypothetical protein VMCG_09437 [Cytospora schulzeri]|uniref:Uncharacterized protein n=1 Tax=Cytospora schulzeri TaxID=448051 RepID=A0A423VKJ2_9PEZI|nr:hypothetical protein VMCG_09437 [Valsa malicola]